VLLGCIDAFNIDVKAFTEVFYGRLCKGALAPVLAAAERAASQAHVELTDLIIPGENDSDSEFAAMAEWVAERLGPETPMHLSAYMPRYRFDAPPTDMATLERARDVFIKRLKYVYLGNVAAAGRMDTFCADCGALLVSRSGYRVKVAGLVDGKCESCGASSPIVH
jgi:pyruvate formate lyase activating enzyme